MVETKSNKIEREHIIPLRHSVNKVPRYKRTNKAIRTIKEFLARHMKVEDRDLGKVKLDKHLNEFVWFRGIKSPPSKVHVKVVKENGVVTAELAELPGKLKFKKERLEKREKKAEESGKKKKSLVQKAQAQMQEPATTTEEEKKEDEKEKKAAVVESGQAVEKAAAKQAKHETKTTSQKQQKSAQKDFNKSSRGR